MLRWYLYRDDFLKSEVWLQWHFTENQNIPKAQRKIISEKENNICMEMNQLMSERYSKHRESVVCVCSWLQSQNSGDWDQWIAMSSKQLEKPTEFQTCLTYSVRPCHRQTDTHTGKTILRTITQKVSKLSFEVFLLIPKCLWFSIFLEWNPTFDIIFDTLDDIFWISFSG